MDQDEINKVRNDIAREFWIADFEAQNPEATKEEVSEAWRAVSSSYRKTARKALTRLERKKGITFQVAADE